MPSIQAKIAYIIYKKLLEKKDLTRQNLETRRNSAKNFGKIFLSSHNANITTRTLDGITVDVIEPKHKPSKKIILYIHGGGFVYGISHLHYELLNRLAITANVKIFAIHYSLAPEKQFPTQLEEIQKIYRWLLKQGYQTKDIFLAGDSAGGNLAIASALIVRDKKLPLPAGIIAISPSTDGTFSFPSFHKHQSSDIVLSQHNMHFFLDSYRGKTSERNPLISPFFSDLKKLPKIQLFVADNELLFDDVKNFSKKLKDSGVSYELHIGKSLAHGYPLAAKFIPESMESIKAMAKFINE